MTQNLRAILATILLSLSVFACSKENTRNNAAGENQLATSSAGVTNSFAEGLSADIELLSSDWTWYIDWDCDGLDGITTITFNNDGTFTYEVGNGYWYKEAGMIMLELNSGACPPTTYAGNIRNHDTIQGMMVASDRTTGCFRMLRGVDPNFTPNRAGTDVNGKTQ